MSRALKICWIEITKTLRMATEVAGLTVNDTIGNRKGCDIIVQYKDIRPRRISKNHS